jgi:hypothetical protein
MYLASTESPTSGWDVLSLLISCTFLVLVIWLILKD